MAILRIVQPGGEERDVELVDQLTVGRSEVNDLVLTEGGVSRRHARFFIDKDQVWVEDIGSSNGTFLDGVKVARAAAVTPVSLVLIGEYTLSLKETALVRASTTRSPVRARSRVPEAVPKSTTALQPAVQSVRATRTVPVQKSTVSPRQGRGAPVDSEPSGPQLRGISGPWANRVYSLRGTVVVGRMPGVKVLLDDDSVSRRHAELEQTPEGTVLRDLESANGTRVNGVTLEEEVLLEPGDVLQFGVIELGYEAPASGRRALPRRSQSSGTAAPAKRSMLWVGVTLGALALVGGAGWAAKVLLDRQPDGPGVDPGGTRPVAALDPQAALTEYLFECRSFSSVELGNADWAKAEAACNKALDLDPIHAEANQLIKKIRLEKECSENFAKGEKALQRLREEEALELFGKIVPECSYYFKAKPKLKESIEAVMKKAAEDCNRYATHAQWEIALPRCESYMRFACQGMSPEQLVPPPGHVIDLSTGKLGRGKWRPKDPVHATFLRVRARVDPGAPTWQCPPLAILRREQAPPDPRDEVKRAIARRFDDKDIAAAMLLYFDGKVGDAINLLQRVVEKQEKAAVHALANEVRRDIATVDTDYKEGESSLQAEEPERAAEPFGDALSVDRKLLADITTPSFFRRSIEQDMAAHCYLKGKNWMDRGDAKRACRVWKLGRKFYGGNLQVLQALSNVCTSRAQGLMDRAESCTDLNDAIELAVEGDQIKEQAQAKRAERKCP